MDNNLPQDTNQNLMISVGSTATAITTSSITELHSNPNVTNRGRLFQAWLAVSTNHWLRRIKIYTFLWSSTLVSANHASSSLGQGPVSQNVLGLFRVPQFPLYLRNAKVLSHETSQSSWFFSHVKDHLFMESGLQFDKWPFGPEKFSGLPRNRPQVF